MRWSRSWTQEADRRASASWSQHSSTETQKLSGESFTPWRIHSSTVTRVADPDQVQSDPDPNADPDLDLAPRWSVVKLRRLDYRCDDWTTDPTGLYFKPLKLLNFDFNADPDPAFHFNADPDLALKIKRIEIHKTDCNLCSVRLPNIFNIIYVMLYALRRLGMRLQLFNYSSLWKRKKWCLVCPYTFDV